MANEVDVRVAYAPLVCDMRYRNKEVFSFGVSIVRRNSDLTQFTKPFIKDHLIVILRRQVL